MKILVVSDKAVGPLAIVQRISKEGHNVKWFSFEDSNIGCGIVDKPDAWRSEIGASDLIVCVGKHLMNVVSVAQSMGKPIIGGADVTGMAFDQIAEGQGLSVLDSVQVLSEDMLDIRQKWPKEGLFVSQQKNDWPEYTWECITADEYVHVARDKIDGDGHLIQPRIIGESITVVGWWNGRKWIKPFHLHWKLTPRECISSGMLTPLDSQTLLEKTIIPLKRFLKKHTYKGPVSVDCILTATGAVHIMNIDMSLRPDYFALLAEGVNQGMTDLLFEAAIGAITGIRAHAEPVIGDVLIGDNVRGAPITGLNTLNLKHIAFLGVQGDGTTEYVSENSGPIMMLTARGETLREASRRIIRSNVNIHILRVERKNRIRLDVAAERLLSNLANWRHI